MPNVKPEQKEKAHYLYLTTNKTQKSIAYAVDVSEQTMSGWVREGNWAEEKKRKYYSPEEEIHHLYEQLREIKYDGDNVHHVTATGEETIISLPDYKQIVFEFADAVEQFYKISKPKDLSDKNDAEAYNAMWDIWHELRHS
jgi:transposase-like protein